jgi:P-type Ca2+ transporter type 2C
MSAQTQSQDRSWHSQSTIEVLRQLETDFDRGLSSETAALRLVDYGPNQLTDQSRRSAAAILREQFANPLVWLLLAAAGVSLFLGEVVDLIAISAIVVLNAGLGFIQDYRAENALAALRKLSDPEAAVLRNEKWTRLHARDLVPGDIIRIEIGAKAPADGRVIESVHLQINEASLTGESLPVSKNTNPVSDQADLADQTNLVFMGSIVSAGRGTIVVIRTGMSTELGRIAGMLRGVEKDQTPLQKRLARLSVQLTWAAVVLVGVMVVAGLMKGNPFELVLMTALSMAVAVIPEGLAAAVTVVLALGTRRMLARHALIRRLSAIETLGSVTVICSDKTGTLTEGRMVASAVVVDGDVFPLRASAPTNGQPHVRAVLAIGSLCSDVPADTGVSEPKTTPSSATSAADPTEIAIVTAAASHGVLLRELQKGLPRVDEAGFDSVRKRMSTVHDLRKELIPEPVASLMNGIDSSPPNRQLVCTKGSLESLLAVSTEFWSCGKTTPLSEDSRRIWMKQHDDLAGQGARILAVAFRLRSADPEEDVSTESLEKNLILIGLIGISDPPRAEAREAVLECHKAGIRPVMITGDHPLTAKSIATQIGLAEEIHVLTGRELARLPDRDFAEAVGRTNVFARVTPEDKLRIVKSLQERGEHVAMTGDGVNDAPALTQSTVGVAMGIAGTDVARDASDVVLLDDNFATIVAAVEEGRIILGNILRFLKFLLSSNSGELWVMFLALLLGMPLPLLPLQILWINLVTDGMPALGLAFERSDRDAMRRPPRSPRVPLLDRSMTIDILWIGLLMGMVSLAAGGVWPWQPIEDEARWRTRIFCVLTLTQLGNALALRSSTKPLWKLGFATNPLLLWSVVVTSLLQLAVVSVPFLQRTFKTTPLSLREFILCPVLAGVVYLILELRKLLWPPKN